jgi:hypothetical protein
MVSMINDRQKIGDVCIRNVRKYGDINILFTDCTKCTHAWNFLEQFSLVRRNSVASFFVCPLKSH